VAVQIAVLGALVAGCGGARFILESPINQRCAAAGLKACPELTAGVLDYVEGNEDEALEHLRRGAAANGKAKIKQFADSLGGLTSLPGADEFMEPINKVIDTLLGASPSAGAKGGSTARAGAGDADASDDEPRPPPRGAAGFRFGQSLEDAEAACTKKASWTGGDAPGCSAALVDVGFEARIKFGADDARINAIAIRTRPQSARLKAWSVLYARIGASLREKYGAPATSNVILPHECRDELPDCLYDGRAKVIQVWRWPTGETISLRMFGSEEVPPAISVVYSAERAKPKARAAEGL
jgi:hypothetical protein